MRLYSLILFLCFTLVFVFSEETKACDMHKSKTTEIVVKQSKSVSNDVDIEKKQCNCGCCCASKKGGDCRKNNCNSSCNCLHIVKTAFSLISVFDDEFIDNFEDYHFSLYEEAFYKEIYLNIWLPPKI